MLDFNMVGWKLNMRYLLVKAEHTYEHIIMHRGCYKGQCVKRWWCRNPVVPLRSCCVYRGCAVTFEIPWPPSMQLFGSETSCVHTTHTGTHRPRRLRKERLDVRLLLFRGRHILFRGYYIVKGFRDSVIKHDTTAASSKQNKIFKWRGVGGLSPRKYLPDFATVNFERPAHAPRSPGGSHTCAVVCTRAHCVPDQAMHVPCAIWPRLGYVPVAVCVMCLVRGVHQYSEGLWWSFHGTTWL